MAINYVRFQRGSQAAYDKLISSERIDENTLYFIYADKDAEVGTLYMGDKLIGTSGSNIAALSLNDLTDVIVEGADTNSFLVKNDKGEWVARSASDVATLIQANFKNATVYQVTLQSNETHDEAIARIVGDAFVSAGDIAIVKDPIANNKYEYTSYVYTGEAWAAMDGNYNATNIYFDTDLTITENIGVQKIDSTGSKVLDTTGKNLKQVLDMIMAARKLPSRSNPSVTVTSDEDNAYEVGTSVTLSYKASLSKGSYTYGPDTGITATGWEVKFNGETKTTATGTFTAFTVKDNTNARVIASATHGVGAVPVDNLGEDITDNTELKNCQVQAGTKVGYSNYVTGYRNAFFGSKVNAIELTSVNLRALTSEKASSSSLSVTINEGSSQVIIAVPAGRKVIKVADEGAFGTDIFSEFNHSIISVGGADATTDSIGSNAKNYNVYVYSPKTALGANTYTVILADEV